MTLTEVLENYFLLPLMQEAWCRSWRQCVQTRPLHTRPLPPSGGAFGALLCRKEFLLNCSSHSPQITEWPWGPGPAAHGCCFRDFPWGLPRARQGRIWAQSAKTTADPWLGGSPDFVSPEKCSYCWCVGLCVSISWKLFIQTSLHWLGKEGLVDWDWETALLLFSEGSP